MSERTCAECGEVLGPKYPNKLYCSSLCANRAFSKRRRSTPEGRAKRAAYQRARHARRPGEDAARVAEWRTANPEKSRTHAQRRRARLAGDTECDDMTTADVGERDGWRCGICGREVDRGLAWPDRMSPSLDHILPLSLGGLHRWDNVQVAHLICNTAKGNRVA